MKSWWTNFTEIEKPRPAVEYVATGYVRPGEKQCQVDQLDARNFEEETDFVAQPPNTSSCYHISYALKGNRRPEETDINRQLLHVQSCWYDNYPDAPPMSQYSLRVICLIKRSEKTILPLHTK